ncbi:MAG TPA: aminotransferase class I/II-fold pyridoxal phosphate-dependent enzyme [Candidatus Binataceae bacterium]|nr:aminotransferase class I/II-fold pyridoxal phosphate-dependent enzyme [Candidatus Binataceae bacterium]
MARISYRVRPETAVLTRGFDPALSVGAARPPVYRSSTFVFPSPEAAERAFGIVLGKISPVGEDRPDLIYARLNHPNAEILEEQLVPLERGARFAAVFNSGMAAIVTVMLTFLERGSELIYTQPLYGGTQHLIHQVIEPLGFQARSVPAGDANALDEAIERSPNARLVLIESPANPTLMMTDIARAAAAVRRHPKRPLLAVDNTLLGPTFQHPLAIGADLAVYSATKFLGGFSDLLAGAVLSDDPELIQSLTGMRALFGNILQADECWILDSRLSTVGLRMNRQSKNAQRIAEQLARHPGVDRVIYPSLFKDPEQIRIRDAQTDYPGSLVTIEVKGGKRAAFDFLRRLKIAKNAVSMGGVESLVCHPMTTTHSELSAQEFSAAGITESMVRISVGTEHWRDLLDEFVRALDAA